MCSCNKNNIVYWNNNSLSSGITGTDVLLNTNSSLLMPEGTCLPSRELTCDGSTLVIEIFGGIPNNATRALKLKIGSAATQTVWSINGVYTSPVFKTRIYLTRTSNSLLSWQSETFLNATQPLLEAGPSFITELTSNQTIQLYINQSVASSIQIQGIKIYKFT